jgi:hypothetical protein
MFRGRTHGQHAGTIAVGVALSSAEDALAVRPQDLETAIRIGAGRGEVQNADSTATPLATICPDTLSQRLRAREVGSDQCGGIKILFNIVWRGAQMSNVDHSALLCIFGAKHKSARRPLRRSKHPPNDQSPLGGV